MHRYVYKYSRQKETFYVEITAVSAFIRVCQYDFYSLKSKFTNTITKLYWKLAATTLRNNIITHTY